MSTQTSQKRELLAHTLKKVFLGVFAVVLMSGIAFFLHSRSAQAFGGDPTSNTINFQARLETNTGAIAPDGDYNIEFNLYGASTGGSTLWTEDYLNSNSQGVHVSNGYITVNLGSITAFPNTINWDRQLWLGMTVRGTGSCSFSACTPTDAEMSPRLELTAVPYAFRAAQLAQYDGSTYASTLSLGTPTGGNQTFVVPDQGAAGTYDLLTQNAANGDYIQNQSASPQLANVYIQTPNVNNPTIRIDEATSQVADNIDIWNSGTLLYKIDSSGHVASAGFVDVTGTGSYLDFTSSSNGGAAVLDTRSSGNTGLIIRGQSGQTGNLLEAQDNNGVNLSKLDANGQLSTYGTNTNFLSLATPAFTTSSTGTAYYYVITAVNAQGETVASTALGMANDTSALNWNQVNGATEYKIYRNTTNAFASGSLLLATITNGTTTSYTDTGSATTAGLPPAAPTGTTLTLQGWQLQTAPLLSLSNGGWISGVDSTGTGYVNMFQVNSNNEIQVGAALNIDGGIVLPTDGGQLTFSDLPIDASASAGTKESYTMRVGSTNALTVYGESDGAGGTQNVRVAIGSSIAPQYTLDVSGIANASGALQSGTASTAGSLVLQDGSGHSITISSAAQANGVTLSIPADTNTSDVICLKTLGNCAGSGGGITGSGTTGDLATFTGSGTIGNPTGTVSLDAATGLTAAGALTIQSGGTADLTLDSSSSSGKVLVGTSSNGEKIQIGNEANSVNQQIDIGANYTSGSSVTLKVGPSTGAGNSTYQVGTGILYIQGQTGATIDIANNTKDQTVNIGNGTGVSAVSVAAGTGGLSLGANGIANTIQIGNTTGAVAQTINIGNNTTASSTNNVNIGSTVAGTVKLQSSGIAQTISGNTDLVQSTTNSIAAFQIQNANTATLLTANTQSFGVVIGTNSAAFGAATGYTSDGSGAGSTGIAFGDFNGDGKQDMVVTNQTSGKISVFMGNGDGTFGAATDYTAGSGVAAVAAVDFTNDSHTDIVAVDGSNNTLYKLTNSGTGTFTVSTSSLPPGAMGIAVGDLNGDNHPDLVIGNQSTANIDVLLNSSNNYGAYTSYTTDDIPRAVAIGDVTGDGKLDVVAGTLSSIDVFTGTGSGTLNAYSPYNIATSASPYGVVLTDLNSDGKLDVVTANHGTDNISVLVNSGTGTFPSHTEYADIASANPFGIVAGDFNGDGKQDIAVSSGASNPSDISIFPGKGDGTFSSRNDLSVGGSYPEPYYLAAADLNGDGKLDLATSNYNGTTGSNASVMLNQSPGSASFTDYGTATFQNVSNSTTAFQIQNAGGSGLLTADTTNMRLTIGAGGSLVLTGGATATRPSSPTEGMLYYDTTTHTLLVYNGTKWVSDKSTATKIVAMGTATGCSGTIPVASGNPDGADYVVTSCTSAQTTINSAISALPSGGGTVYLEEGTYIIDGSISLPANVTLAGTGPSTIIELKDGINANINAVTNSGNNRIIIRDLKLLGNKSNNTSGTQEGIYLNTIGSGNGSSAVPGATVKGVYIEGFRSDGLSLGTVGNSTFTNMLILNNGAAGMTMTNTMGSNVTFTNNLIQGNASSGVLLKGSDQTFTANTVQGNGSSGIAAYGNYDTLTGNTVAGNTGTGISLGGSYNTITGNTITGNVNGVDLGIGDSDNTISGNNISSNTGTGISLGGGGTGASNELVTGNKLHDNGGTGASNGIYVNVSSSTITDNDITDTAGTGYAIAITSNSASNYIANNRYSGTGASSINNASTTTIFANQLDSNGNLINSTSGSLAARLQSGSSADLFQLQDSNGNVLSNFTSAGNLNVASSIDTYTATGLNIGTTKATGITIGSTSETGTITLGQSSGNNTINIGSANLSGSNVQTINIGAPAGGSGYENITIGKADTASVVSINGAVVALTGNNGISLNVNGGGGGGAVVKTVSNSTTGFQIQNSNGGSGVLFTADTSNMRISIGSIGTATGQLYIGGKVPVDLTAGGVATGTNPQAVAVSGRYAYVADNGGSKLQVFDISNPASPTDLTAGGVATGTNPSAVAVAGHYAYVLDYTAAKLQVFDISNPHAPSDVSSGGVSTGTQPDAIVISGRYAYVADFGAAKLQVFDISNPASPTDLTAGGVTTGTNPISLAVSGRYLYAADDGANKLQVFDISNPASPTDLTAGGVATSTGPYYVQVIGRYAYVADFSANKLQVFDISNPASPTDLTAGGVTTGTSPIALAVSGRYAYVADNGGSKLQVFDISNPASPSDMTSGGVSTGSGPSDIVISGRYAYVVDNTGSKLQAFDLGGTYSQQLEAGGTETGTLMVDGSTQIAGDASIQGALSIGQSLQVGSGLSVNGVINSVSGYSFNGTVGKTITCSSGNYLDAINVQGGIITNGSCTAAGGGSGVTTVGTFSASSQVNGATISGMTITFGPADGTNPGMVSTGTQTFAGFKTFTGGAGVAATSGTAFQIQNTGGSSTLLTADTSNMRVSVGSAGTATGQLYISGSMPTSAVGSATYTNTRTGHTLAVQGRYVYTLDYVSGNDGLEIYDATQPSSPYLTNGASGMSITQGVTASAIEGHYLYTVGGANANGFHVIDISNPNSPTDVAQLNVSSSGLVAISVQGKYAYMVTSSGNLYIYDISNPIKPVLAGSNTSLGITTVHNFGLAVQGKYAYIAAYSPGALYVLDVSNPSNITLVNAVGGTALGNNGNQIVVQGRYAYIAEQTSSKIQIFDISNPATPTSVGSTSSGITGHAISLAIQGERAYLLDDGSNLYSIDVSNPASPTVVGSVTTTSVPLQVVVSGRYAYVTGATLQIFDLGGTYSQQFEAGGAEVGTLQVDNNANFAGDASIQGGLSIGQSLQVTGNVGMSGQMLLQSASNSISAFVIQDASANPIFTVDTTSNQQVTVGNATNGVTISISGGIVASGTARHTKKIHLTPEYAGAVLDATNDPTCTSANTGTMTSGYSINIAGFGNQTQNYYKWTTTGSAQCYDVVVQVPVPMDFSAWASTTPLVINDYTTDTTNGKLNVQVTDTAGTTETNYTTYPSITPASASTWTAVTGPSFSGTYTAGGTMTISIRMTSSSTVTAVELGNITLSYLSKF